MKEKPKTWIECSKCGAVLIDLRPSAQRVDMSLEAMERLESSCCWAPARVVTIGETS